MAGGEHPEAPHGAATERPRPRPRTMAEKFEIRNQGMQRRWWWRMPNNYSPPVYRFLSVGLGASMWFWVRFLVNTDPVHPGQVSD